MVSATETKIIISVITIVIVGVMLISGMFALIYSNIAIS